MKNLSLISLFILSIVFAQDFISLDIDSKMIQENLDDIQQISFNEGMDIINVEMLNGNNSSYSLDDIEIVYFNYILDISDPKPLEFREFYAKMKDENVEVLWKTGTEINIDRYEIQRKHADSEIWEKIKILSADERNKTFSGLYKFIDVDINGYIDLQYQIKQIDNEGNSKMSSVVQVYKDEPVTITQFKLYKNYPNPFNPFTNISYEIPKANVTKLIVYDLLGSEIEILFNMYQVPGKYNVVFDGRNVSSGVYICKLESGTNTGIIKMVLLK